MEQITPKKPYIHVQLTPSTKQFTCVLCGERKTNAKDRQKLVKDGEKTDLYHLIEKLLRITITEEGHSDMCCRNCAGRLTTIEKSLIKFKESYEATRSKLTSTHGHKVYKRSSTEQGGQSKRALSFSQPGTSTDCFTPDQLDGDPRYSLKYEDLSTSVLTDDDFEYSHIVDTILHGNNNEIVHEIMKIQCLAQGVQDYVFELLKSEVKTLCLKSTNSLLRQCEKGDLLTFSFKNIAQEWTEKAPLFYKFLDCVSVNPSAEARNVLKKGDSILQAQVAAGCKLLNVFNREMKSLQLINDIVLLKGGMKKSGFTRLQSTNDCQSYMSAITLADKIASDWDRELLKWKQELELEIEQENRLLHQIVYAQDTLDLCNDSENVEIINELTLEKSNLEARLRDYRSDMHPGYYFVGDNVDMVTKVRQMTSSNQNKDQHMYQMCAYQNRVSGNNLDNEKQLQDPATAPFGQLIPGETEKKKLSENFAYLVAKRWCQYLAYFGPFEGVLQEYIEHPYMRETKKCTKRINMGVLKKNEAKNEDMADICKYLHQYVPGHREDSTESPVKTLSGGDYLTFERHKQAQMSVRDDSTPSLRLEGLVPKLEEFHNQAELMKVIWQTLYSTVSSRDIGTLYAARNVTNSRNVSADPAGNFYASAVMADKFTDAYIVAGALEHFQMNSVADDPKTNTYQGPLGSSVEMKCFILEQAQVFIDKYVCIDVAPLPSYGPQCNTLVCRYCGKVYKQPLGLRKHEHKVHDQEDPRYAETSETLVQSDSSSEDMVLNYTKHALTLGLLRANHDDAITMGDGDRMMLVNLYLYLLYKVCKCPKYAYGLLETMCQSKILLTERMAHRLTWNRTVNHRGKINSNHPNDLDLEHCNRVFKDEAHSFRGVFTNKTIARVSRSALCTDQIAKNYDKQTNTKKASGIHTDKDITEDVMLIVNQLKQQNVFDNIPGRHHQSFPAIEANPWSKLDMENVRDWISQSLHKFSSKHFY